MNDANGRPLYQRTEYIAEGTPYLYDEYCFSEITTVSGRIYTDVKVKINLLEKFVVYMADNGDEMIATMPISRIRLMNFVSNGKAHGEKLLESVNNAAMNAPDGKIFEVIENGKAKLLKELTVTYNDDKKYGEATITRVFTKNERLFALLENTTEPKKIEKNKTAIIDLFGAKKELIRSFIEGRQLKCKTEEELAQVFRYYNSI